MKASAWNKSRVIPPITNFLVLMFSIMAPVMVKGKGSELGERKNVTPSEEQSARRRRNVASAAGGKASWSPPFLLSAALLLPLNFQGGGKKKEQSHDWEGLGFIPEQPTQDREGSAESPAPRRPRSAHLVHPFRDLFHEF